MNDKKMILNLPYELYQKLDELAKKQYRSKASLIRQLISEVYDQNAK